MTMNAEPKALEERENLDIEDPKAHKDMVARHLLRYEWARHTIKERLGRNPAMVIDFACGTGYGTAILARDAQVVLGRDKDAASVEIAEERFRHMKEDDGAPLGHADFKVRDASQIGRHSASDPWFDAFVCIETIEHLEYPDRLLGNILDLLIPGGILVLSTPRGVPGQPLRSKYHLFEWSQPQAERKVFNVGFCDLRVDDMLPGFICLSARKPL